MSWFRLRSHTVRQASTLLVITALLSNVLGLGRNIIFYRFISRADLDVYYASFRISDFIFNVLIFGAITSAVIPIIADLLAKKEEQKAWSVINQLLSWSTLALLTLIIILYSAMPTIMGQLVSHFNTTQLQTSILLSRYLLLQTLFFSWSFILGALLNGYSRFTTYALAPLIYNFAIICGGFLARHYGVTIVIYTVVIGAACHLLIQYFEVRKTGFRLSLDFRFTSELKSVLHLMVPRSLSQAAGQVLLLVYTHLGSGLEQGSIAIFSGMNDLQTTPTVVIANSLATACFPTLSAQVAEQKWAEMNLLLVKGIRIILFLLLPTLAISLILRAQIVRLYFGISGASWELTNVAIRTFAWFMLGIIPASLVVLLSRVFYASRNTRSPMLITIATSCLGIVVSSIGILSLNHSVATLAVSETTISFSQCFLYFYLLHQGGVLHLPVGRLIKHGFNYISGSLLMAAATWLSLLGIDRFYSTTHWASTLTTRGLFLQTLLAALVGITLYFGYSTIRSKEELQWVKQRGFSRRR